MSDEEDFMISADEEDYDFDYEDDDDQDMDEVRESEDIDQENKYYNAKALKEDDAEQALQRFKDLSTEEPLNSWTFKAAKQAVKLQLVLGKKQQLLETLDVVIAQMASPDVTKSAAEKSINNLADRISTEEDDSLVEKVYAKLATALSGPAGDRLRIRINIKLATMFIAKKEVDKAKKVLSELRASYSTESGLGTYLLEVYALEMQLCSTTGDIRQAKKLYNESLKLTSAIAHPRILGIIRECGGKVFMRENQWDVARQEFFESFRNYDEAGSLERVQVLKYYVMACMLSESGINPFDSQETKPYRQSRDLAVMASLVQAYQTNDLDEFNYYLQTHKAELHGDEYISNYLDLIVTSLRSQTVLNVLKPYTRLSLFYLAKQLGVAEDAARKIVIANILDGKLQARLDDINAIVEMDVSETVSSRASTRPSASEAKLPARFYRSVDEGAKRQEQNNLVKSSASNIELANLPAETTTTASKSRIAALSSWAQEVRKVRELVREA